MVHVQGLKCRECGREYEAAPIYTCEWCFGPLEVAYDYDAIAKAASREKIAAGPLSLWRYSDLLPVVADAAVDLGTGFTPLVKADRLAAELGLRDVWVKNDTRNPTNSFKARGLSAAVTRALHLGARTLSIPTAGNAGNALAAYAARAGLAAKVFMPKDVKAPFVRECLLYGADVTLVDGLITDAGRIAAETGRPLGWYDVSTLNEPYRIEGKKTMGYELAEQLGWRLPDLIFYPTGGGTGLIGMWKAFAEMEALGWIDSRRPRARSSSASGKVGVK